MRVIAAALAAGAVIASLAAVAWSSTSRSSTAGRCLVHVRPIGDGGCDVSWCHYYANSVVDSQVDLRCGGEVEICGEPYRCACDACEGEPGLIAADGGSSYCPR